MRIYARLFLAVVAPICCSIAIMDDVVAKQAHVERFEARNSVEMVRIHNGPAQRFGREARLSFSPSGQVFATVLKQGNIESGYNTYSLVLYHAEEVFGFVKGEEYAKRPSAQVIAKFKTMENSPRGLYTEGIDVLRWTPDGRYITFIGRKLDGNGQVYAYSVNSGEIRQLTDQPNNIVSYGISSNLDVVVYAAYTPPSKTPDGSDGYIVSSQFPLQLLGNLSDSLLSLYNIRYYVDHLGSQNDRSLDIGPDIYQTPHNISVSPSGRYVVIPALRKSLPASWLQTYRFFERSRSYFDEVSSASNSVFGPIRAIQYYLIDLRSGRAKPLIDAPAAIAPGGVDTTAVVWSNDEKRVIVTSAYVPEHTINHPVRPLMLEVDVSTSAITPIAEMQSIQNLVALTWTDEMVTVERSVEQSTNVIADSFVRRGGRWERVSSMDMGPAYDASNGRIGVRVTQSLNSPPEIEACIDQFQCRVISDLNPQIRSLKRGRTVVFSWQGDNGAKYSGGLVYPPDYQSGRKYPLVIQANGFNAELFLIDGPDASFTAPHAALAIASRDILVLQMRKIQSEGRSNGGFEDEGETPRFMKSVESAIDELSRAGLIDKDRVGLMGFSREGMYVHYTLAFSDYTFAAATVADSFILSPFAYAMTYGTTGARLWDSPGVSGRKYPIGAPLWGAKIKNWLHRSYLFNLERIRTPIRYEEYGTPIGHFEAYFVLRRSNRPVEMFRVPLAGHVLAAPRAIFASQEGNADWFDFWLNDRIDPAPRKQEQYSRWGLLRDLQERVLVEPRPPLLDWTALPRREK